MTRSRFIVISALLALLSIYGFVSQPNHRVFLNGKVLTVNSGNDIVEAISIRNGVIVAIGSNAQIKKHITWNTRVSDLQGNTLIPGFVDAHSHFPSSGLSAISINLNPPPTGTIESIDDIRLAFADAVKQPVSGEWLLGFGYDDSSLSEQRHPTRQELDDISTSHAIFLWHSSGHMGVTNSAGLAKLGIDEDSPIPQGGFTVRDPETGYLNGLLQEKSAPSLGQLTNELSILDYYRVLDTANADYSKHGITTAQSGSANTALLEGLAWASRLGLLPFRLVVLPHYEALGDPWLGDSFSPADYNSDWFTVGPLKLFADGSPQGYTAYLTSPYFKAPQNRPGYRGFPAMPQPELIKLIGQYHHAGIQLAVHGNGDAAIDNIIEAFELAGSNESDDPRSILVHAQMVRNDQLEKMRRLGITPSFFNSHTFYWGDIHRENAMGPERAAAMSPARSAQKTGLRFSLHSDAPVTPINPLQLIWSAVTRETLSGKIIGGDERISLMSALRAVTIDAAWQVFQEKNRGSLEVGKFADLVILSGDLLDVNADIRELDVIETLVGGKTIYKIETTE